MSNARGSPATTSQPGKGSQESIHYTLLVRARMVHLERCRIRSMTSAVVVDLDNRAPIHVDEDGGVRQRRRPLARSASAGGAAGNRSQDGLEGLRSAKNFFQGKPC